MNEQEINTEFDSWTSKISKFIISRSSQLLSSDTQKDGRILILYSAISSLIYLGIVKYSPPGIEVECKTETIIPIIIEMVCIYFALSFIINAYSDLKIYQFKTLIKGSDDEEPLNAIKRTKEEIDKKGQKILEKYEELIANATKEFELDTPIVMLPKTNDISKLKEFAMVQDERFKKIENFKIRSDIYLAAKDLEFKELNVERDILNFKIASYDNELPSMVKIYKFKFFITIAFPLLSFLISIFSAIYFIIKYLAHN